ncbi:MAG TPA: putative lipid II flippase FtsW [Candidatus Polarisedimenticolaceae bacterium]|nr:putative lipid II flippase FtsW [Candidatus Polarisedimenticolaceae bacterium]
MPRTLAHDHWLFFSASLLALAGLFMVGSASTHVALASTDDPSAYLWKHLVHLAIGFVGMILAMSFDYRRLADGKKILILFGITLGLLILVLAMPESGGAHRWIELGPFRFQPSEMAKLVTVLFMAYVLAKKEESVNDLWSVPIPTMLFVGTLAFLVVIEPDLGSAVMLVMVAGVMVFAAGLGWRYVAVGCGLGATVFGLAVIAEPYRLRRILGYLNPTADLQGLNFQLHQSLIALGHGGLTGTGLGQGQQKWYYLPAAHTDFIFSVVGEEVGLLGTVLLLLAFLLIFWRGLRAAVRAPDRFGSYLALGITNLIVLQALVNMCVCLGLLPTKGLPLPFISYGGSALLVSMTAMGLLLNVSKHSN